MTRMIGEETDTETQIENRLEELSSMETYECVCVCVYVRSHQLPLHAAAMKRAFNGVTHHHSRLHCT